MVEFFRWRSAEGRSELDVEVDEVSLLVALEVLADDGAGEVGHGF